MLEVEKKLGDQLVPYFHFILKQLEGQRDKVASKITPLGSGPCIEFPSTLLLQHRVEPA